MPLEKFGSATEKFIAPNLPLPNSSLDVGATDVRFEVMLANLWVKR